VAQNFSKHQQNIIKNYYQNFDTIMMQKLQELVSDLYLADTDKKKTQLWERVHKAMINLKVPNDVIVRIMQSRSVELLAKQIQAWLNPPGRK